MAWQSSGSNYSAIMDQDAIRRQGMDYDRFIYSIMHSAPAQIADAYRAGKPQDIEFALLQLQRMHMALLVRCRNKEYMHEYYPQTIKKLFRIGPLIYGNPQLKFKFLQLLIEFENRIMYELKYLGFAPPREQPFKLGEGPADE